MVSRQEYWESVYRNSDPESVGWFQPSPELSLQFVAACGLDADAPVIDVGGGSSSFVDGLLDTGLTDVSVLDLSASALGLAQRRLGSRSGSVTWIEGDVATHDFGREYQLWHDRAAFHFLTDEAGQDRYLAQMRRAVGVGGDVVIATFAADGPERCSGLAVQRYDQRSLSARLGTGFESLQFESETHFTPSGVSQRFLYGHFRRIFSP